MNIYSFPTFNLTKVLFTAEELELDYQLHLLDVMKGEHKQPEHMQRHPLGKVPVVELHGQFFFESNSICRLLAEENGNKLYGNTPVQRAIINQWIDLMGYHIGRWMTVYFFEEVVKPRALSEPPGQAKIDEAAGFLRDELPLLESAFQAGPFIIGPAITIADTIMFAMCQIQECTSLSLEGYPALWTWYQSMGSRPATVRALGKLPGGCLFPFPP